MVGSINNVFQSPVSQATQPSSATQNTARQNATSRNADPFNVLKAQNTAPQNPVQQIDNLAQSNERSLTAPRGSNLDILV